MLPVDNRIIEFQVQMICPQCKEDKAHRTPRQGIADALASWFRLKPWLCPGCKTRFRVRTDGPSPLFEAEMRMSELTRSKEWRNFRRNWLGFVIAGIMLALGVMIVLRFVPGGQ